MQKNLVGPAAERIHPGEDVGEVLAQLVQGPSFAVMTHEMVPIPIQQDQDAAAGRTVVRLDDKVAAVADRLGQTAQLRMRTHHGVDVRRLHADATAQMVHPQLVIDQRKQAARIVIENAGRIAPIHAQDAEFLEPFRGAK